MLLQGPDYSGVFTRQYESKKNDSRKSGGQAIAVLWSQRHEGRHYEVRGAGSSLRLYTDGVLHSQFSPRRVVTGSIWDLLWLGLYFDPRPEPSRVLLLGLGAGTVVLQLQALFPNARFTAVEQDPIHIEVARTHFGVDETRTQIHCQDAGAFVARYRGPRFDLVIDDLFIGSAGTPRRAVSCDHRWLKQLKHCLDPHGILSINFADHAELKGSALVDCLKTPSGFKSGFGLRSPATENVIAALLPFKAQSADLRAHLAATPDLASFLKSKHLRFQVRRIDHGS